MRLCVVVPTMSRPEYLGGLIASLKDQTVLPDEVVVVDASPSADSRTEEVVKGASSGTPFELRYLRSSTAGTSIQRNLGIDEANGDYVGLLDDDVRPKVNFFEVLLDSFARDREKLIGGIAGYRENLHVPMESLRRWRWYRRLRLFSTYEPGRFDWKTGYPINQNLQPPFDGLRDVDFLTTACALWRRAVFDDGLRFFEGFGGYGVVEDAHFSLRAGKKWKLKQCGSARCEELRAPGGRGGRGELGYKKVFNYRCLFLEAIPSPRASQELRFWLVQSVYLVQLIVGGMVRRDVGMPGELVGRLRGWWDGLRLRNPPSHG